ncbi:MAG: hypothetical protein B7X95_08060 [Methylophilaceae bacterium 17-44-8]|jgi:pilus assembly protein CpaE|nr:MAG: hypothetical protein B7X95_08060 [Methylophilaceae bacterium 17-44-8]
MKVLLISENNHILEVAISFKSLKQRGVLLETYKSNLVNASQKIAKEIPDVVLVDIQSSSTHEFDLIERYKTQYKNMAFMMLSGDSSSELLLSAMRSGFSEVISLPLTEQSFVIALDRFENKFRKNIKHQSKVLSVISCKGGAGATFISTNLGFILAEIFNKKVLLIDANQYFGDASLYLSDTNPPMTLADVCNQIHRLDYAFLESSLIEVTHRYKILAAADNPASISDVRPEHLDTIIRIAKNYYDFIIIDLGRQIDALTVKAMDLSDEVYPVVQLTLPYIRDAKHLLDMFKSLGYNQNKIKLTINRYEKNNKLKLEDLHHTLATSHSFIIPNEYNVVSESVNQGVAVARQAPNGAVTKALKEMGEKITGIKLSEKGFFTKIFNKG